MGSFILFHAFVLKKHLCSVSSFTDGIRIIIFNAYEKITPEYIHYNPLLQ